MLKEIPYTQGFLASETGEVYSPAGELRNQYVNGDGYSTVAVLNRNDAWVTYGVHRLVALAFLETEVDPFLLTVNHKDHNKSNNHVSNLEWVTAHFNNVHHALSKVPTRPMILMWQEGQNSVLTDSLETAGELVGCSPEDVWQALQRGVPYNGFWFRHQRSRDPLPVHLRKGTIPRRDASGRIPTRAIKLKDIYSGEVTFYPSMTEAAVAFGVLTGHLSAVARAKQLSLFKARFQVVYADEEFQSYPVEALHAAARRGQGRSVSVIRSNGSEMIHYPSANEFISQNDLSKKAITVRLKRDGDLGKVSEYDSYRFAYTDLNLFDPVLEESSL